MGAVPKSAGAMKRPSISDGRCPTFLATVGQFSAVSASDLQDICKITSEKTYAKHETIILEGTPSSNLYFVASGQVRCFKTSLDGREQTLFLLGRGDSFNYVSLFGDRPSPFSVEAIADGASVYFIPCYGFLHITAVCQVLLVEAVQVLAREMTELATLAADLSFLNSSSRIAKFLLDHGNGSNGSKNGESPCQTVVNITQSELASLVGCAREHASRSLKILERSGAVQVGKRSITLADHDLLSQFANRRKHA